MRPIIVRNLCRKVLSILSEAGEHYGVTITGNSATFFDHEHVVECLIVYHNSTAMMLFPSVSLIESEIERDFVGSALRAAKSLCQKPETLKKVKAMCRRHDMNIHLLQEIFEEECTQKKKQEKPA